MKAQEAFRACEAIFSSTVSKNEEEYMYTPESYMKRTALQIKDT